MIDILLATYNGEKYLSAQLDSILKQTYQDFKILIHDDGSTDNTIKIIKKYALEHSDKLVVFDDNIRKGGACQNFSYLLQKASSPYIMFCDQDDIWLENRVQMFLSSMKDTEKKYGKDIPLIVFSDLIVVDEKLNIISESMVESQKLNPKIASFFKLLKCQNVITGCAMMINKKALEISIPIPQQALMHDWWIALNVAKYGKNIFLEDTTILYRQHSTNLVGYQKPSFIRFLKILFSKKIFNDYIKIKNMLNEKMSFYSFCICKIKVIFLRIYKK
ncbi:glycosyltransferase family 2 protein [Sulfurimonas microaerophilic]|uniref:glycosyltransferase family 2 protein n=1 Tax=Sulfurimonas microaerophilic TaxID=3058392 RepID=UPI0027156053|nr:glycosyltransferase family 2 protein [Sulfurimonas sp. hsl 1-7]